MCIRDRDIGANVLATAQEIPRGFFLIGRDVNRGEGPGAIEHGELRGIASIRLHSIARPSRNECRRDDVAGDRAGLERAAQLEPARPAS